MPLRYSPISQKTPDKIRTRREINRTLVIPPLKIESDSPLSQAVSSRRDWLTVARRFNAGVGVKLSFRHVRDD